MFRPEAPTPPPHEDFDAPVRRILVHPIHAAAIGQASANRMLKEDYYLVEDSEGLHEGTLKTVFIIPRERAEGFEDKATEESVSIKFVLNSGEELLHEADADIQLFRPVAAAGPVNLEKGDYIFDGKQGKLVGSVDPNNRFGEGLLQVTFEGEQEPAIFYKDDPRWSHLTVYRATDI
jgi:hypothetical protein